MLTRRAFALAMLLSMALLASCEGAPGPDTGAAQGRRVETVEQAIRPTDGTGWNGNGYGLGVNVESYATPGGHLKVWYATDGDHRVSPTDANTNGVPDYVELVGLQADKVWAVLIDELGLHAPLNDALYHDRADYGGDERFDIYLQNISQNDGYRVVEACLAVPFQCAGYLVMENDFLGFGYDSQEEAVKVLTSHEFAHGVLDAYDSGMPQFLSEGFATWAEEAVFPEQTDFEGFLRYYFREPDRPLDAERPGDFSDLFPYGAAIWPRFLEERYGMATLLAMLEELVDFATPTCEAATCSTGQCVDDPTDNCDPRNGGTNCRGICDPELWPATDAVLTAESSSLAEAFTEFAVWNAMTGRRAGLLAGVGYADAAFYPEVPIATTTWRADGTTTLLDESFNLDRLSASYLVVPTAEQGTNTVTVTAYGRLRFVIVPMGIGAASAPITLRPAGALDRVQVELPPAGQVLIIAVNAASERMSLDGNVVITGNAAPVEPVDTAESEDTTTSDTGSDVAADAWDAGVDVVAETPDQTDDDGCGCRLTTSPTARGRSGLLLLGLVGLLVARRRR